MPAEMLLSTLAYCSTQTLLNFAFTCKYMSEIVEHECSRRKRRILEKVESSWPDRGIKYLQRHKKMAIVSRQLLQKDDDNEWQQTWIWPLLKHAERCLKDQDSRKHLDLLDDSDDEMATSQFYEPILFDTTVTRELHITAELNPDPFVNSEKWPTLLAQFKRRLSAGVYHDGFAIDYLRIFIVPTRDLIAAFVAGIHDDDFLFQDSFHLFCERLSERLASFQSPVDDEFQSLQFLSRCHVCGTSWGYRGMLYLRDLGTRVDRWCSKCENLETITPSAFVDKLKSSLGCPTSREPRSAWLEVTKN